MNPLLETTGQIAAIIICLFIFVFIILAVAFNLAMVFGMSWLAEKIQVIKRLRPTVESVNKATGSALEGLPPDQDQNRIIRTATSIPVTMHNLEKQVDQRTDKVADAVIEFRARTVQAKTIVKALFLPGLMRRRQETAADKADVALNSSGYQAFVREQPAAGPVESAPEEQIQHASIH